MSRVISGQIAHPPVGGSILATRQLNEKKLNEALDKAVIELSGLLPDVSDGCGGVGKFVVMKMPTSRNDKSVGIFVDDKNDLIFIGSGDEFTQRAKELGFINGYRWGVEYPTNGKRPDLPDDVEVKWFSCVNGFVATGSGKVNSIEWKSDPEPLFHEVSKFTVVDQRYKPADTSYLNALSHPESEVRKAFQTAGRNLVSQFMQENLENAKYLTHKTDSLTHSEEGLTHSEWYCYETEKALRLPPVGAEIEFLDGKWQSYHVVAVHGIRKHCVIVSEAKETGQLKYGCELFRFRPRDHAARKAELEKSKFIKSALDSFSEVKSDYPPASNEWLEKLFGELFDAGFKAPDQK